MVQVSANSGSKTRKSPSTKTKVETKAAKPANNKAVAKSRFNAALEEAKAGAAALRAEASERAAAYRSQAQDKGGTLVAEARAYGRSEEHTSELQSLRRSPYAVFCLKKKNNTAQTHNNRQ